MKRLRPLVSRPAAVLSLLVCAVTAILWVRSYRTMDEMFLIYKGEGSEELSSLYGQVRLKHTLPRSGTRDGVARISHRPNRVVALPPRPWAEDRLKPRWLVFRYDDSRLLSPVFRPAPVSADPKRVQAYRDARAAYSAFRSKRPSTTEPSEKFLEWQKKDALLRAALLQAQAAQFSGTPPGQGAQLYVPTYLGYESYWAVTFPMWLLMVPAILLVTVAWLLSSLRRAVRSRAGRCRACGYDLTGNTSGICPECGATVNAIATAPTA